MLKSLHLSDFVVLAMAVLGITAAVRLLGVTSPAATMVFAMGWASPAVRRLIAWRRGRSVERRVSVDDPSWGVLVLAFGAAPWVLLPLVHALNPAALALAVPFPVGVKWIGAIVALAGVLGPLWPGRGGSSLGSLSAIEAVGLFLVSGSVLFAAVGVGAAVGVAALTWSTSPAGTLVSTMRLWSEEQRIVSF